MLRPSSACSALVQSFEQCRLKAYLDVPGGIWTIGWGHTDGVRKDQIITQQQADEIFAADLEAFSGLVEKALKVPVTQGQFDALVSFAYNVRNWQDSDLFKHVNQNEMQLASAAFEKYVFAKVKGVSTKLNGLVRRRKAERALFDS